MPTNSGTPVIRQIRSTPALLELTSAMTFSGSLDGQDLALVSPLVAEVIPGSGSQWSLAITSTTFTTGTQSLPTTATSVNVPFESCDGWFTTACTPVAAVSGDPSYPFTVPAGSTAPPGATFFSDETGAGQQTLSFPVTLTVPADARPGAYTSTWTVSIQSGP